MFLFWFILNFLGICHANIRGLSHSELLTIQTDLCDLLMLSETYLSANSTQECRLVCQGKHFIYKRLLDYEHNNLEMIWIELNTIEGKILICYLYRAPWDNEFWDR